MADGAVNHWPMSIQSAATDDDEQLYFNVSSTAAISSAVGHHTYKYVYRVAPKRHYFVKY